MLLWFIVVTPVVVAEVFRSPMVDYRLVMVGAALPAVDAALGRPTPMHTLGGAVVVLAAVMASTMNRRLVRRRLLGIPIGMFVHLVLDGTWSTSHLFWWPAFGVGFGAQSVPEQARGVVWGLVFELVAVVVGWWAWRRYGLGDAAKRRLLMAEGHLAREVLSPG